MLRYHHLEWISGHEYAVCYAGSCHYEHVNNSCGNLLVSIFQWFRHQWNKQTRKRENEQEIDKEANTKPTAEPNCTLYTRIQIEDDEEIIETKQHKKHTEALVPLTEHEKANNEAQERIKALEKELEKERRERIQASERITALEKENAVLIRENKDVKQRSMQITERMSALTNMTGNFENVNDEHNNSRLAQKLESLYSNKWVMVARDMIKTFRDRTEVENISILTDLMKDGYQKCKDAADAQVCHILQVKSKEDIPANEDISDIIQLRRNYAVKDSVKGNVKKDIIEKLLQREDMCAIHLDEKGNKVHKKLTSFLEEFVECCWLMTVSNPTMVLDFNVVGQHYTNCQDHFKVYSTKKAVEDKTKVEGEICEVVWPCVQLEDESAIYMKGDVIVVKKGKLPT